MRWIALVMIVVAACGKGGEDKKRGPRGAPGAAAAGKGPTVTREGKPVEIVSTYAVSHGGSAIDLVMTSYPNSCDEAAQGMQPMDEAQMMVRVTLAPQLSGDGTTQWAVAQTYYRGGNRDTKTPVEGGPFDAGKDVSVTLPHLDIMSAGKQRETVTVEGPLVAKGCGSLPGLMGPGAKARPQSGVTFEIAGKPMAINGAVIERRGGDTVLRLATGGLSCEDIGFDSDVVWEAYLSGDKVTRTQTRGAILHSQSSAMIREGVTVALSGASAEIHADYDQTGYHVKVDGKVDALECK